MGIIINDNLTFKNGCSAQNTYCSFFNSTIELSKGSDNNYYVRSSAAIYFNKSFRNGNKPILDRVNVSALLNDTPQLDTNLYEILYEELKERYENTTDD